uniref:Uncharacterized protein n=1 Tax=Chromera velia CCMP2878 TaxID=1169474 RepID=A0A0G4HIS0_9ALVE|eukprot:Cvel_27900.t1-p1 / transcript=Cvel_27900.t1 / gene=Cvel_27900 / organism=Chromera_velia_CCMP2878 / gene_product=S-antigen protein, putative / transcript_product=S-antigen protein, putative / location=Cvel_scaffold3553:9418-10177(-) / protein_length=197 / sequence_SO=supercontig / SO=protein_coding / is_pseudo=false
MVSGGSLSGSAGVLCPKINGHTRSAGGPPPSPSASSSESIMTIDCESDSGGREDETMGGREDEATGGREDETMGGREDEATGGREDETMGGREDEATGGREDETMGGREDEATGGREDEAMKDAKDPQNGKTMLQGGIRRSPDASFPSLCQLPPGPPGATCEGGIGSCLCPIHCLTVPGGGRDVGSKPPPPSFETTV